VLIYYIADEILTLGRFIMERKLIQDVYSSLRENKRAILTFEVDGKKYLRRWCPKERLIILGGGHIAQPLCEISAMLDFDITVVDDRPYFANKIKFPNAQNIICNSFENAIDEISIKDSDYVCVVTRGHRYDADCLRKILSSADNFPYYIGMIGSKRRVKGLKEFLIDEGFEKSLIDKINAPIGLDIGAQTTAEIAVSIVAQLVEYRRKADIKNEFLSVQNVDESVLDALCSDEGWVLAVVIETKGSTPVKDGAIMAVNALGQTNGTVGGGCSEAEVISIARNMANQNEKKMITVDMTNDVAEEDGMVCGGSMKVLIETVN
jgi:xanthine dehydrogenase accessory factor